MARGVEVPPTAPASQGIRPSPKQKLPSAKGVNVGSAPLGIIKREPPVKPTPKRKLASAKAVPSSEAHDEAPREAAKPVPAVKPIPKRKIACAKAMPARKLPRITPARPQSADLAAAPWRAQQATQGKIGSEAGSSGYVFLCNTDIERECAALHLLCAPLLDLGRLQQSIDSSTRLFLFNYETCKVVGMFGCEGSPTHDIVPKAFGGKFGAQIRIRALLMPPREMQLDNKLQKGSMTPEDADALQRRLDPSGAVWTYAGARARALFAKEQQPRTAESPRISLHEAAKRPAGSLKVKPEQLADDKADVARTSDRAPRNRVSTGLGWNAVFKKAVRGSADRCEAVDKGPAQKEAVPDTTTPPVVAQRLGRGSMEAQEVAGYVFLCTNGTQDECDDLCLFGAPEEDLARIQRVIRPHTELFLLNGESKKLFGPYVAIGEPHKDLVPGAFGGKLSAQIPVMPLQSPPLEVRVENEIAAGPKSAQEVVEMKALFATTRSATGTSRQVTPASDDGIQERKRPKRRLPLPSLPPRVAKPEPPDKDGLGTEGCGRSDAHAETSYGVQTVRELDGVAESDEDQGADAAGTDLRQQSCWKYLMGKCRLGVKSKLPHVTGACAGYVFMCSSATQKQCQALRLLGSPSQELRMMQQCIRQFDTELFLFNFQTMKLMGPFVAVDKAESSIVPNAWGGKFSAQVMVTPLDVPLLGVQMPSRIPSGPLTSEGVQKLKDKLALGAALPDDAQEAWSALGDTRGTVS